MQFARGRRRGRESDWDPSNGGTTDSVSRRHMGVCRTATSYPTPPPPTCVGHQKYNIAAEPVSEQSPLSEHALPRRGVNLVAVVHASILRTIQLYEFQNILLQCRRG